MDCFCMVTFDRKSDLEIECVRGSGLGLIQVAALTLLEHALPCDI